MSISFLSQNICFTETQNIAKALIGSRKIKIQVTGIRPGEKVHEIMVSEEECNHTVKSGGYYAIVSMVPELNKSNVKKNILKGEFSSANNILSFEDTKRLLEKHRLLVGQRSSKCEEILE